MEIRKTNKPLKAVIQLPGSKSISNRSLMIRAYSRNPIKINFLSEADDTLLLRKALDQIRHSADISVPMVIDCGNAGTVYRFLLSYLASKPGQWLLTGALRMLSRPIGDLVDSLRSLGADISYTRETGFPPVLIKGKVLKGGRAVVATDTSSQFASSLVMAAPMWEKGLDLELTGTQSSMPYLEMTLSLMEHCGAKISRSDDRISVLPVPYRKAELTVEADWSAAAFWYELVGLSHYGELFLKGLSTQSLQGDKKMIEFFKHMGVSTFEEPDGILIFKSAEKRVPLHFDLHHYPDMLPALVAVCCGLGFETIFTGLRNLEFKESDRTLALQKEMKKIGCQFEKIKEGEYKLSPSFIEDYANTGIVFQTYGDHRLAMAFAPLVAKLNRLTIERPEVVEKSYPNYWTELFSTGLIAKV